ncbi:uncharacterized protein LOC112087834 [Eutrema salsugineum]|uniref:uncharacterized protein LOC112087834 n=1 Tax=Eutrema salsugineum TaxID=72664 RepID=UPI000CED1D02|nr:uncharacterized protein LOC112087834 [Eutrema salsugineum]
MENSSSSATSFNASYNQLDVPLCHCRKPTRMAQSWTDDNPGRVFFKCDTHGFSVWADKEKPFGWQKLRLIEAREQIRRQKEEIRALKTSLRETHVSLSSNSPNVDAEMFAEEKKKLEFEAMAAKEREKLLRQFVVISWGGFIVVTTMILTMVKK